MTIPAELIGSVDPNYSSADDHLLRQALVQLRVGLLASSKTPAAEGRPHARR